MLRTDDDRDLESSGDLHGIVDDVHRHARRCERGTSGAAAAHPRDGCCDNAGTLARRSPPGRQRRRLAAAVAALLCLVSGLAGRASAGPDLIVQNGDRVEVELDPADAPLALVVECPAGTTLRARVRARDAGGPINVSLSEPGAGFPARAETGRTTHLRLETEKQGAYRLELRPTTDAAPVHAVVSLRWTIRARERHRVQVQPPSRESEHVSFYGGAGELIGACIRAPRRSHAIPRLGRLRSADGDTDLDLADADVVVFEPLVSQVFRFELTGQGGAGPALLEIRRHRSTRRIVAEPSVLDGAQGSAIFAVAQSVRWSTARLPPSLPLAGGELRVPASALPPGTTVVAALGDALLVTESALDPLSLPMVVATHPSAAGTFDEPIELRLPLTDTLRPWSGHPSGWWPPARVFLRTLQGDVIEVPDSDWIVEEKGRAIVVFTPTAGTLQAFSESEPRTRLSADSSGTTLVVGHPGGVASGVFDSGEVLVYAWDGAAWQLNAVISAPEPRRLGHFGESVCISGDLLVVAEPGRAVTGGMGTFAAHVFRRDAEGEWRSDGELIDDGGTVVMAGRVPTLAVAGESVFVGSDRLWRLSLDSAWPSVLVYEKFASGWKAAQRLIDPAAEIPSLSFGHALAASSDRVVVGVTSLSDASPLELARVYRREVGGWAFDGSLSGPGVVQTCELGAPLPVLSVKSVAISGDRACVGRNVDELNRHEGIVTVYERRAGVWQQLAMIQAPRSDVECRNDDFGYSCAMSSNLVVVGAPVQMQRDEEAGTASVFQVDPGGATFVTEFAGPVSARRIGFGARVLVTDVPESRVVVLSFVPARVVEGKALDSLDFFGIE